jgi:pimeloyl-ACP methyl ester carboxylesterase
LYLNQVQVVIQICSRISWRKNGVIRYDRENGLANQVKTVLRQILRPNYMNYLKKVEKSLLIYWYSMGGPYIRIFRDLYPNEVKGLIFLDSSHPSNGYDWNFNAERTN